VGAVVGEGGEGGRSGADEGGAHTLQAIKVGQMPTWLNTLREYR